jgi:hypothetical protein
MIKTIITEAGLPLHQDSSTRDVTRIYAGFNLNDVSDNQLREILQRIYTNIESVNCFAQLPERTLSSAFPGSGLHRRIIQVFSPTRVLTLSAHRPIVICMEIDGYTKALLTIIVVCLILLCWQYLSFNNGAAAQIQLKPRKRLIGFTGAPFATE